MFLYILSVFLFISTSLARDLPSYFPTCSVNDINLNDCLLNATRVLKPKIIKGVKEIELPSFNPLILNYTVSQNSDLVNYTLSMINFTAYGFDSYEFDSLTYDPQSIEINGSVRFKNIQMFFSYIVDGRLMYFPIRGEGTGEVLYGSINGTFQIKGKIIKKHNVEYYHVLETKVRMKVIGTTSHFDRLFGDNAELAHLTNELININGQEILDGVTPALEKLTEGLLIRFMRTLTKLIPYRKMFLDT